MPLACARLSVMPRMARVIRPGTPYHVTQRGNRREPLFFTHEDRALYWSSAGAHAGIAPPARLLAPDRPFGGRRPHPVTGAPLPWSQWLALGLEAEAQERLRRATSTGRPCGSTPFVATLESELARPLTPRPRGRPRKQDFLP
jgi:hypothetical protein